MKILIVDDHWVIRVGVKSLLEQADDVSVVGEARDAAGALRAAETLAPDLVVLDIRLEGESTGVEVCREIKSLPNSPRVLIHTALDSAEDLAMATLAGADGYVHKGIEHVELVEALRRIHSGEHLWLVDVGPREVSAKLQRVQKTGTLTRREQQVFALLVRRYSNGEIARQLHTSLNTTKNQVSSIFRKLGIGSRKEFFRSL